MVVGMSDTTQFWANLNATMQEVSTSLAAAATEQEEAVEKFVDLIGNANRVVVNAAGRSGLALRMTAMRLMPVSYTHLRGAGPDAADAQPLGGRSAHVNR